MKENKVVHNEDNLSSNVLFDITHVEDTALQKINHYFSIMRVTLPTDTLYDGEILHLAEKLKIPNFRGVKMRDELPKKPREQECGVLNFNTHDQSGSHWVCWLKTGNDRYYFDSYGEPPPDELMSYLKTYKEMTERLPVIRQSAVTVQHYQNECGSLCLYVLKKLTDNVPFSEILNFLHKRYNNPSPLTLNVIGI